MTSFSVGDVVSHPAFGVGVIISVGDGLYKIDFTEAGLKEISRSFLDLRRMGQDGTVDLKDLVTIFKMVLADDVIIDVDKEIGERWIGGKVILTPGKNDTMPKEIPIDRFLAKIISVREKLRVLEQKINNHPKLSDVEKLDLQQYITRSYGSLTTFNILFRKRGSHFGGTH